MFAFTSPFHPYYIVWKSMCEMVQRFAPKSAHCATLGDGLSGILLVSHVLLFPKNVLDGVIPFLMICGRGVRIYIGANPLMGESFL